MNMQSYYGPTMAPPGTHTMWLFVWPMPYDVREGHWKDRKREMFGKIINTVAEYGNCANLKKSICAIAGWTPWDEQGMGVPRGGWCMMEASPSPL